MAWHKPTNINEWLGILLRHKKKFFFPAMAVMLGVVWSAQWWPRSYYAEVKFQRLNDPALQQMGGGTNVQNLYTIRRQLDEELRGRAAIEQLVNDLQLTRNLPHEGGDSQKLTKEAQLTYQDMIGKLGSQIHWYFQVQSEPVDVVVVTYTDANPELTSKVANQIVENYIRKTSNELNEMLLNAKTFFEREVARYHSLVEELEGKKLQFEMNNPGLTPNDPLSVQTRLVELRSQLDAVNHELSISTQQRIKLQEMVKTMPEMLETKQRGQNPIVADLMARRSSIEAEIDQLKASGRKDEHPLVKHAHQRLAELDKQIANTQPETETIKELVPNTTRMQAVQEIEKLSGTMVALERKRDELAAQADRYESMNRNFFVVRNQYLRYTHDLDEAQSQAGFWESNLRRTMTALTAEVGQRGIRHSILQRADELGKPTKPTLWGILSVALVAGLGAGLGLIFLAEVFDSSFHSVDQALDSMKLPVLGTINEIITPSQSFRQRVLSLGVYPATAAFLLLVLFLSIALTYFSLQNPQHYDLIVKNPGHFLKQTLFGS